MREMKCVYSDAHVKVLRSGGEAPGSDRLNAPFYRIRVGAVELTYDVGAGAWYVYMPGRERMQTPVRSHPYYLSEQGFTMVNIDWDHTESQVFGIEILGGSSREAPLIIDVPEPEEESSQERGGHLRVIRPEHK